MRERALQRAGRAKAKSRTRQAKSTTRAAADAGSIAAGLPGARRAAMPEVIEPSLCTLVDEAPAGDEWIHEIKFDGYRIVAHLDKGRVRLLSRNGKDWTTRFEPVARAVAKLPATRAIFDGEVCIVEADGTTSFQALQNTLGGSSSRELTYFVFDLVHLEGYDLSAATLRDRKAALARLLKDAGRDPVVVYSDHVEGGGREFYAKACEHGLEGVISKLAASPYRQVRSRDWRKTKCLLEQEFVIVGWTEGTGTRTGFGALLLGVNEKGKGLRYAGKVGTGFTEATLRQLSAKLARIERAKSPLVEVPAEARRGVHWVEPKLVGEVAFLGWTRDERLRHPSFQGLREDRSASEVVREVPAQIGDSGPKSSKARARAGSKSDAAQSDAAQGAATARARARASARAPQSVKRAAGIAISNSAKVLFPDPGVTKGEVAAYYEMVAPWMLPHVAGRPLTLVRCPDGYEGECFFQKNAVGTPREIERVTIPDAKGGETSQYGVVRDAAGLVTLLQMGVLEIHIWGSKAEHLEKPDRIVFDLDPDPGVSWDAVVEGARFVRATLARLGLVSHLMLTGGKGLHVVLFVEPEYEWPIVKEFSHAVVKTIVRAEPKRYTDLLAKSRRSGRIFLDYLRNGRGATAVAPFSTRAKAGAPVAVPIDWKELDAGVRPDEFHVRDVGERLARLRSDPWKLAKAEPQSLRRALEGGKEKR